MRRLYFMVPHVESCKSVVEELQANGVTHNQIHVLARDDIPLEGLHQASALQKTELAHGVEMGLGVGGFAGMLGGLMAVTFPPAGLAIGGGALVVAATTIIGAGFGSLVSALVAGDIPNHELERFQDGISRGEVLIIVDVPIGWVEDVIRLIKIHHPEATVGVVKATKQLRAEAA